MQTTFWMTVLRVCMYVCMCIYICMQTAFCMTVLRVCTCEKHDVNLVSMYVQTKYTCIHVHAYLRKNHCAKYTHI